MTLLTEEQARKTRCTLSKIVCAYCGAASEKPTGEVNRAHRAGANVYCDRICAGLGRRGHKTDAEKREEKRLYDIQYRAKNRTMLKIKKAEWHKRTYDPIKAAQQRKENMPRHVEYCRRPEYRKWKRQYDRQYRAKRKYGAFWECFLLTQDIRDEALARQTDYEIRLENGTFSKRKERKRDDNRTQREEPEISALGNLASSPRGRDGSQPRRFYRHTGP